MNALEIFSEGIGSTVYYGPGAGPEATASAIIADLVDISKGGWDLEISSNYSNRLEISSVQKAARYYRLQVKDQPGVIAKISSLFGEKGISIDALIQHEARSKEELESVPLVIISGEITDNEAEKLKDVLEGLPEVLVGVKKFRIHPGRE